jgi:hypothetical protein
MFEGGIAPKNIQNLTKVEEPSEIYNTVTMKVTDILADYYNEIDLITKMLNSKQKKYKDVIEQLT